MGKIGIYYNEDGLRAIMKSPEMEKIEEDIMQQKLSQIQAEFLQTFGFQGSFGLRAVATNSKRSRLSYRIVAEDAKTTAALKKQPGWLARFL